MCQEDMFFPGHTGAIGHARDLYSWKGDTFCIALMTNGIQSLVFALAQVTMPNPVHISPLNLTLKGLQLLQKKRQGRRV